MKNNSERIYKFALWLLLPVLPIVILFLWGNTFTTETAIDANKFGTFGDFFGGVLGAVWSLCGVLLFYHALREQTKDFATNRVALEKQVEALQTQSLEFRLQREEFSLQRDELRQSRNVITEQSKTLSQQRLDSVYFALLNLYNTITSELNQQSSTGNFFKDFKNELLKLTIQKYGSNSSFNESLEIYLEIFYKRKEELTHYFRLVYRIIKTIEESDIGITEKFKYVKILRSQLSENEMLALFYNSHSSYGGESYKLILKFNVLKHLPAISKLEFYRYILAVNAKGKVLIRHDGCDNQLMLRKRSIFMQFNNEVTAIISEFILELEIKHNEDSFKELRKSEKLPYCDNFFIALESSEINELRIEIVTTNDLMNKLILSCSVKHFSQYFKTLLLDIFIYSRYLPIADAIQLIDIEEHSRKLIFQIRSSKKLTTNQDIE